MNEISDIVLRGLDLELHEFFGGLNWTFINMYVIILYGITYKREFEWFNSLMDRLSYKKFTTWIAGFFITTWIAGFFMCLIFCLFKWLDNNPPVTRNYISTLLRSWFIVVVFVSVLIGGIIKLIRFTGKK